MTYTKKQFLEDVAKEARALKKHSTKEEIGRLSLDEFVADDPDRCIYGLLGLNCRSARSVELITKCCNRFFSNKIFGEFAYDADLEESLSKTLGDEKSDSPKDMHYISSVEAYICWPHAKNANLIAFLKGERNDLVL